MYNKVERFSNAKRGAMRRQYPEYYKQKRKRSITTIESLSYSVKDDIATKSEASNNIMPIPHDVAKNVEIVVDKIIDDIREEGASFFITKTYVETRFLSVRSSRTADDVLAELIVELLSHPISLTVNFGDVIASDLDGSVESTTVCKALQFFGPDSQTFPPEKLLKPITLTQLIHICNSPYKIFTDQKTFANGTTKLSMRGFLYNKIFANKFPRRIISHMILSELFRLVTQTGHTVAATLLIKSSFERIHNKYLVKDARSSSVTTDTRHNLRTFIYDAELALTTKILERCDYFKNQNIQFALPPINISFEYNKEGIAQDGTKCAKIDVLPDGSETLFSVMDGE
jgi:hypothetical protein